MKITEKELVALIKEEVELLRDETPAIYINEMIKQVTEKLDELVPSVKQRLLETKQKRPSDLYAELYNINKKLTEVLASVKRIK